MRYSDPVYGPQEIEEPVVLDLLATPAFERLKGVNTYGTVRTPKSIFSSRFEHCVGVYLLLRKFNASLSEQIAGLLHDVSHIAFSHTIDHVFSPGNTNEEYQDQMHESYLCQSSIRGILQRHQLNIQDVARPETFVLLERRSPDLCADRIDYSLRNALAFGLVGQEQLG